MAAGVPFGHQRLSIGAFELGAIGDQFLSHSGVPAQEGGIFPGGGGQVVGAVLADQFRAGGDAAAVGVVGDGEVVFLYRKGLIAGVGIGPVIGVGGLDFDPVGPRRQPLHGVRGFRIEVVSIVFLPGAIAVFPVHIDIIMGGEADRRPGDGDQVPIPIDGGELPHLGRSGLGRGAGEDGILAGEIGLEIDQAPDGSVVLRQELFGGGAWIVELGIPAHRPGDGNEMAAVFHPGDDIVAAVEKIVDLGDHVGQRRGDGEKGLIDKVEPGRRSGGDAPKGEQCVFGAV